MREPRTPFFCVNPKAYLYGEAAVALAKIVDDLAIAYDLDVFFTAQHVDASAIIAATKRLLVTVQHMDSLVPGPGMGYILPEALAAAGVKAVFLNHCEHPLTYEQLQATIQRAKEVGLMTIVCANSIEEGQAAALLEPTIIVCEPSELVGTGKTSDEDYRRHIQQAILAISPKPLILQAAGISTVADVLSALAAGADGTGGTSGIVCHDNPEQIVAEMLAAVAAYKGGSI